MSIETLNLEEDIEETRTVMPELEQRLDTNNKKQAPTMWDKMFPRNRFDRKQNQVAVLLLTNNGKAEPMIVESKKGFFNIKNKIYHEDKDCIYTITKERLPLAIIPEWSLVPYGTKIWHDKSMLVKFNELQDHVFRAIRQAEMVRMGEKQPTNGISPKTVIVGGIIAIVIIAIVMQYI